MIYLAIFMPMREPLSLDNQPIPGWVSVGIFVFCFWCFFKALGWIENQILVYNKFHKEREARIRTKYENWKAKEDASLKEIQTQQIELKGLFDEHEKKPTDVLKLRIEELSVIIKSRINEHELSKKRVESMFRGGTEIDD